MLKDNIVLRYLKNRRLAQIRKMMRGYRYLKSVNKLDLILNIKDKITKTPLESNLKASELIFGVAVLKSELIVKQYLLSRVASYDLNKALLRVLGTPGAHLAYPLPQCWLNVIKQNGIEVNYFKSKVLWQLYLTIRYLIGILTCIKILWTGIGEIVHPAFPHLGKYIFFDSLTKLNLPKTEKDNSFAIVNWYINWEGKNPALNNICHTVKNTNRLSINGIGIVALYSILPPLQSIKHFLQYLIWTVKAIVHGLVYLLSNRWWEALFLQESSYATLARTQDSSKLASEYLFHNSSWLYRPLWTYETEKFGSRILFYFYSTNSENFKTANGYGLQANSWEITNWPIYLVWDNYQAEFVGRYVCNNPNVFVTGPIWFVGSDVEEIQFPENAILVFDVQPRREALYQFLGAEMEYYTPKTANQFLVDIYHAIDNCDGIMLFKRKRDIGKIVHYQYRKFVGELSEKHNFINLNADISAHKIIRSCKAVISMPFTSTAIIAKSLGKPSIYYDPFGVVRKDDRAAHGIPVITGTQELNRWVKSNI